MGTLEEGGPFTCPDCEGMGSTRAMQLLRAYRRGYEDGVEAMRKTMPNAYGTLEPMTVGRLWRIVNREEWWLS